MSDRATLEVKRMDLGERHSAYEAGRFGGARSRATMSCPCSDAKAGSPKNLNHEAKGGRE